MREYKLKDIVHKYSQGQKRRFF